MTEPDCCLVLRLAGPLQAWGGRSEFNRRDTAIEPSKSGIVGLLAAAEGRRRQDDIEDLLQLSLGVRTDQPGSLMRDYHTVSDLRGRPLLSASVNSRGVQKPTSPAKFTHVTERFYLQDAVFVAAIGGPPDVLHTLRTALRRPAFPLALGRRACVPTQPLVLDPTAEQAATAPELWAGTPLDVLRQARWEGSLDTRRRLRGKVPPTVDLPIVVDDPDGNDVRTDVPGSTFDPKARSFRTRRVRHEWARELPTGASGPDVRDEHDPFALLGW